MDIKSEKWSIRLVTMALGVASWSKDTSTKVGAIIVDDEGEPISWGYNGMPPGVDDTVPSRLERPAKYCYFEHAERNAIYQANKDMRNAVIFVTHMPCSDCTRAIIKKKIKRIVVDKANGYDSPFGVRLREDNQHSMIMIVESETEFVEIDLEKKE